MKDRAGLVGVGDPEHVGIEEEEEDHAEDHKVHIDAEEDSAVIEAPAGAHAADRVHGAKDGCHSGEEKQQGGAVLGKVREEERGAEAEEHERVATYEGRKVRIEDAGSHAVLLKG